MAFETTATVLGAATQYRIAPEAKKYTLRDNGFTETNGGNFQLIRGLEATPQSKEGFKLKITVAKDLQTFKMSITTAAGCLSKRKLLPKAAISFKGQEVCHSAKQAWD